jgi:hypothetical protein
MSEKKKVIFPEVFVKGGTSSSSYDVELAKKRASAKERRSKQERMYQQAQTASSVGAVSRVGSHKMVTSESPKAVLYYLNRDGSIRQECISEITTIQTNGELDLMFTLVCPRCLERGVGQDESNLMVKQSHRKWHLNQEIPASKKFVMLTDPFGNPLPVLVAGEITVENVIRCSNYNCNWACRIDESKVREV